MIDVALLGIIRRWHLRNQIPIREIARRLDILAQYRPTLPAIGNH